MVQFVLESLEDWQKKLIVGFSDFLIATLALWGAFYLRLNEFVPSNFNTPDFSLLIIGIAILQSLCFLSFGFYRGIWRYSSVPDLIRIIKGVSVAILLVVFFSFIIQRGDKIPRSVFLS